MVGAKALILSFLKNYVSQWEVSLTFVQSKAAKFSLAHNALVSAVEDLSNLTSIASQRLTSEELTIQTLYDSTPLLGFP